MNETVQPAVAVPVEPTVRPRAWISMGACELLQRGEGPMRAMPHESEETGFTEPLYHGETLWNACARAGEVEREKIKARLLEMHERDKSRHNYWKCAVVELFGA